VKGAFELDELALAVLVAVALAVTSKATAKATLQRFFPLDIQFPPVLIAQRPGILPAPGVID
jgi:hypothetical protein